jgi:predicted TIM-barrel fold metal-dependent hydrolase
MRASLLGIGAAVVVALGACHGTAPPLKAADDLAWPVLDLAPPPPGFIPANIPHLDTHTHIEPGALTRAKALLGSHNTRHFVNLSGGWVGGGLEELIAEAKAVGDVTVFCNVDFREVKKGPGYGARLAKTVAAAYKAGARGLKIFKNLGLGVVDAKGKLIPVDDPGLDPLFAMAGKLHMPVAIHTGDPKAFWKPATDDNERIDELSVHPRWSFYGHPFSWEQLYAQFERRVTRSPKTIFIGVHFGNDPEDPVKVAAMLDAHKNLYIDLAARIPEIGRIDANHDPVKLRAFFEKYQDRILWATDTWVGNEPEALMFGSNGATPPTEVDEHRFFDGCYRWLETNDKNIPTPTPIQGRWNIDGIGLPRDILEKVYWKNGAKLLGIPDPK